MVDPVLPEGPAADALLEGSPAVPLELPPVPAAPIELVPLDPVPLDPLVPPALALGELVLPLEPLLLLEAVDGLLLVEGDVLDVGLSVLDFFEHAPSDKAAAMASTATALWVRDVFIKETP